MIFVVFPGPRIVAQETRGDVDQVLAAFVYQLTNYVEWPSGSALKNSHEKFIISVIGDPSVSKSLKAMAESKTVHGSAIEVRQLASLSELRSGHIAFLKDEKAWVPALAKTLGSKGILMVSFGSLAAPAQSMIHFYEEDNRIRLRIHRKNMETANFKISSQLLKLAVVD